MMWINTQLKKRISLLQTLMKVQIVCNMINRISKQVRRLKNQIDPIKRRMRL